MADILFLPIFIVIITILVIISIVRSHSRRQQGLQTAERGDDKTRLRAFVESALPGQYGLAVAFAHHEESREKGTSHYYYAVAFDDIQLWVIPIRAGKTTISAVNTTKYYTLGNLTGAKTHFREKKDDGIVTHVITELLNTNNEYVELEVNDVNIQDSFCPLSIRQQEESKRFSRLAKNFADQFPPGTPDAIQDYKKAKGAETSHITAICLGILGLVTFWLPFSWLLFGGTGILFAVIASKQQGKLRAGFWLGLASVILGIIAMIAEIGIFYN